MSVRDVRQSEFVRLLLPEYSFNGDMHAAFIDIEVCIAVGSLFGGWLVGCLLVLLTITSSTTSICYNVFSSFSCCFLWLVLVFMPIFSFRLVVL